jgi:uncharacterized protein with von Willebrand factor type A (vWA) domain
METINFWKVLLMTLGLQFHLGLRLFILNEDHILSVLLNQVLEILIVLLPGYADSGEVPGKVKERLEEMLEEMPEEMPEEVPEEMLEELLEELPEKLLEELKELKELKELLEELPEELQEGLPEEDRQEIRQESQTTLPWIIQKDPDDGDESRISTIQNQSKLKNQNVLYESHAKTSTLGG